MYLDNRIVLTINKEKEEMSRSAMTQLPGFHDFLGQEAKIKNYLSAKLAELFQLWGYERIELSVIEKLDSFSERIIGRSPWPEWNEKCSFLLDINDYSLSYSDQPVFTKALLVPEGTVSVSRWLANQISQNEEFLKDLFPLKIFYVVPCFRNELITKLSISKNRHFTQIGTEILGVSNRCADLEIMILIAEGLKVLGIPIEHINIRIGDIRIFNKLCHESKIKDEDIIPLKECFDAIAESRADNDEIRLQEMKKILEKILEDYSLPQNLRRKWELCLSGWRDIITSEEAELLGCYESVSDLNYLALQLRNLGIHNTIDLAVVRSHEYYTAVVFEVDIQFCGQTIIEAAGGGRYNKMIGHFLEEKLNIPAIGFAYGLERLFQIFRKDNEKSYKKVHYWLDDNSADIVVYGPSEKFCSVFMRAQQLRSKLLRTSVYIGDDLSENAARCYTKSKGLKLEVII